MEIAIRPIGRRADYLVGDTRTEYAPGRRLVTQARGVLDNSVRRSYEESLGRNLDLEG